MTNESILNKDLEPELRKHDSNSTTMSILVIFLAIFSLVSWISFASLYSENKNKDYQIEQRDSLIIELKSDKAMQDYIILNLQSEKGMLKIE